MCIFHVLCRGGAGAKGADPAVCGGDIRTAVAWRDKAHTHSLQSPVLAPRGESKFASLDGIPWALLFAVDDSVAHSLTAGSGARAARDRESLVTIGP